MCMHMYMYVYADLRRPHEHTFAHVCINITIMNVFIYMCMHIYMYVYVDLCRPHEHVCINITMCTCMY